tara:strand:- start:728 stop:934 length:207 start_codon:yes stop_codon:yes gene_type:complete
MRIKLEDYFGNDIVELNIKKLDNNNYKDNIFYRNNINIIETDEYNIADVDEDEKGEYIRLQLTNKNYE